MTYDDGYPKDPEPMTEAELKELLAKLQNSPHFASINLHAKHLAGGHVELTILGDPGFIFGLGPLPLFLALWNAAVKSLPPPETPPAG